MREDGQQTMSGQTAADARRLRHGGLALRFGLLVVAPVAAVAFYIVVMAADRYVAEAHFTVRDSGAQVNAEGLDLGKRQMREQVKLDSVWNFVLLFGRTATRRHF